MFRTSSSKRIGVINLNYWAPYPQKDVALHIRVGNLENYLLRETVDCKSFHGFMVRARS